MKKNRYIAFSLIFLGILFIGCDYVLAKLPNSQSTMWDVVNKSLTDLLNEGWKPVNQSSNRAAIATTGGRGSFDDETHAFLLFKNGKYITCFITNPSLAKGVYSQCRALN
jgi:hypothetical protein